MLSYNAQTCIEYKPLSMKPNLLKCSANLITLDKGLSGTNWQLLHHATRRIIY